MAKFKNVVITNSGLALITATQNGGTIEFTGLKMGNGIYYGSEVLEDMTALKSVKKTLGITDIVRNSSVLKIRSVATNEGVTEGYYITEIGLFAKDASGKEILYAIFIAEPDRADYFTPYEEFPQSMTLEIYISAAGVDESVTFTASIVEGVYATVEDLEVHKKNVSNPHSVTKAQIGLGNVNNTADLDKPVSTATQAALNLKVNTSDYNAKVTELAGDLSTHSSNTSNPHSVTKAQVGLGNVPNVATNDQTPTYTAASSNTALTSGEKLSVAFGKIAKAISSLISHIADNKSHLTPTTNGSKLTNPLELALTKGDEGLTVGYPITSEYFYKSTIGGQKCSFIDGNVTMNPAEVKCKGNLFASNVYVGNDTNGYSAVLTTKGNTDISLNDKYFITTVTEYGFATKIGGGDVDLCNGTMLITIGSITMIGSIIFTGAVKNKNDSSYGEILHTGNCAPVIISSTAPTNTNAVWWDTSANKIKRYSGSAWVASS